MNEMFKTEKEKQTYVNNLNVAWRKFIAAKLEERNFEYLLEFTEEAKSFMKGFIIKDVCWTQNYHWGELADFKMDVLYKEQACVISGAWSSYAFPYIGDDYVFLHSAKGDELFADILKDFGLHDALMKLDGHNWTACENSIV